jgi:hypothetical protein
MDELLATGMLLLHHKKFNFIFMENLQPELEQNFLYNLDLLWTFSHRNTSVFLADLDVEPLIAMGGFDRKQSEPLFLKLKDGLIYNDGLSMLTFHGDPLLRRVSGIVGRVVEAGLYNHWISLNLNEHKVRFKRIALDNPLDEYYSFKMYHMHPAFYLLLMGWCLSFLCFMVELLYNRFSSKRK